MTALEGFCLIIDNCVFLSVVALVFSTGTTSVLVTDSMLFVDNFFSCCGDFDNCLICFIDNLFNCTTGRNFSNIFSVNTLKCLPLKCTVFLSELSTFSNISFCLLLLELKDSCNGSNKISGDISFLSQVFITFITFRFVLGIFPNFLLSFKGFRPFFILTLRDHVDFPL